MKMADLNTPSLSPAATEAMDVEDKPGTGHLPGQLPRVSEKVAAPVDTLKEISRVDEDDSLRELEVAAKVSDDLDIKDNKLATAKSAGSSGEKQMAAPDSNDSDSLLAIPEKCHVIVTGVKTKTNTNPDDNISDPFHDIQILDNTGGNMMHKIGDVNVSRGASWDSDGSKKDVTLVSPGNKKGSNFLELVQGSIVDEISGRIGSKEKLVSASCSSSLQRASESDVNDLDLESQLSIGRLDNGELAANELLETVQAAAQLETTFISDCTSDEDFSHEMETVRVPSESVSSGDIVNPPKEPVDSARTVPKISDDTNSSDTLTSSGENRDMSVQKSSGVLGTCISVGSVSKESRTAVVETVVNSDSCVDSDEKESPSNCAVDGVEMVPEDSDGELETVVAGVDLVPSEKDGELETVAVDMLSLRKVGGLETVPVNVDVSRAALNSEESGLEKVTVEKADKSDGQDRPMDEMGKDSSNEKMMDVTPPVNHTMPSVDEEPSSTLCLQISSVCSLAPDDAFQKDTVSAKTPTTNVQTERGNTPVPLKSSTELETVSSDAEPVVLENGHPTEKAEKDPKDSAVLELPTDDDSDDCMVVGEVPSIEKSLPKSECALNSSSAQGLVPQGKVDLRELERLMKQTPTIKSSLTVKLPRSERPKTSENVSDKNENNSQVKLRIVDQGDFLQSCQEAVGVSCKVAFKSAELSGQVPMFFCNFCNFSSANRNMFISHVVKHLFLCKKCGFQSVTRLGLLKHMVTHRGTSCCPGDDYNIIALSQMNNLIDESHQLEKTSVLDEPPTSNEIILEFGKGKRYFCALCDYRTNTKMAIERHVLIHVGCWICPHCFNKFEQFTPAVKHLKAVHSGEDVKLYNRVVKGSVEDDAQSSAPRVVSHRLMNVTVVNDPIDVSEYHYDICTSYLYLVVFADFHMPLVRAVASGGIEEDVKEVKKLHQLFVAKSRFTGQEDSKTWLCDVTGCKFASQFAPHVAQHSVLCHPGVQPRIKHKDDQNVFTTLVCKSIKAKHDNLVEMMSETNKMTPNCLSEGRRSASKRAYNAEKALAKNDNFVDMMIESNLRTGKNGVDDTNTRLEQDSTSTGLSSGTCKRIDQIVSENERRLSSSPPAVSPLTAKAPNLTNLLMNKRSNINSTLDTVVNTVNVTTSKSKKMVVNQNTVTLATTTPTQPPQLPMTEIITTKTTTITSVDASGVKKNIMLPANMTIGPNTLIKTPDGYFLIQPSTTATSPIITMTPAHLATSSTTGSTTLVTMATPAPMVTMATPASMVTSSMLNVTKTTTAPIMSTGVQKTLTKFPNITNIQRASSPLHATQQATRQNSTKAAPVVSLVSTTATTSTVTTSASSVVVPSNLPSGSKSFFKLTPGTNISLNSGKNKFTLINKGGQLFLQPTDPQGAGTLVPVASGPNGTLQLNPSLLQVPVSTPTSQSGPLTARMNAPPVPTATTQTVNQLLAMRSTNAKTAVSKPTTSASTDVSRSIFTVNASGQVEINTIPKDTSKSKTTDKDKSMPVDPSKIKKEKLDEQEPVSKSSTSSAPHCNVLAGSSVTSSSASTTTLSQALLNQINRTNSSAPRIVLGTSGSVVSSIGSAIVTSAGQPTLIISGRNQTPVTLGTATSLLRQFQTSQGARPSVQIVPTGSRFSTTGNPPPVIVMRTLPGTTSSYSTPGLCVGPRMTKVVYQSIDSNGKRIVQARVVPASCVASTITTSSATRTMRLTASGNVEEVTSEKSVEPGHVYVPIENYCKVVYTGALAKFSCNFCAYSSSDRKDIQQHLYKHNGKRWYRCPYCPHESTVRKVIFSHTVAAHPGKRVGQCISVSFQGDEISNCPFCDYTSSTMEDIVEHIASEHPDPSTDIESALMHDSQEEDSNTPLGYQCNHCEFTNADLYCLKVHILVEHQGRELIAVNLMENADTENQDLLFMCSNRSCLYSTTVYDELVAHSEHCIPPSEEPLDEEPEEDDAEEEEEKDTSSPKAVVNSDTDSASSPVKTFVSKTKASCSSGRRSRTWGPKCKRRKVVRVLSSDDESDNDKDKDADDSKEDEDSCMKPSRLPRQAKTLALSLLPKKRKVLKLPSSDDESVKDGDVLNDGKEDYSGVAQETEGDEHFQITINKSGDESNSQSALDELVLERANEPTKVTPGGDKKNLESDMEGEQSDAESVCQPGKEAEKANLVQEPVNMANKDKSIHERELVAEKNKSVHEPEMETDKVETVHDLEKDIGKDEQDTPKDGAESHDDEPMDVDMPSADDNDSNAANNSDADSVTLNVESTINQLKSLGASIEGSSVSDMFSPRSFTEPFKSPEPEELPDKTPPQNPDSWNSTEDNWKHTPEEKETQSDSEAENNDAKSTQSDSESEMPLLKNIDLADAKTASRSQSPLSSRSSPMPDLYIEPDVPGSKEQEAENNDLDTWLDNIGKSSDLVVERASAQSDSEDLESESDGSHVSESMAGREIRLFEDVEDERCSVGGGDSYHGDDESIAGDDKDRHEKDDRKADDEELLSDKVDEASDRDDKVDEASDGDDKVDEASDGDDKVDEASDGDDKVDEASNRENKVDEAGDGEENKVEEAPKGITDGQQNMNAETEAETVTLPDEEPSVVVSYLPPGGMMSPDQIPDLDEIPAEEESKLFDEAINNFIGSVKAALPKKKPASPKKRRSVKKFATDYTGMPSGYKCMYCDETNDHVLPLKIHIMHFHPTENLVSIDLKAQYNRQRKYVQFCMLRQCDFYCMIMKDLVAHYEKFPDHVVKEEIVKSLATKAKTERLPKKRRELSPAASVVMLSAPAVTSALVVTSAPGVAEQTPLSPAGSFDLPDPSEVGSDMTYDDDATSSASAFSENVFSELVGPTKVRKRKQVNYNEGHLAGIMEQLEPKKKKKFGRKSQNVEESSPGLETSPSAFGAGSVTTAATGSILLASIAPEIADETVVLSPKKSDKPSPALKKVSAKKEAAVKKDSPATKKGSSVVVNDKADKVSTDFKWNLKCGHCLFHDKNVPNMKNHLAEKHADEPKVFATDVYARHQRKKSSIFICLKPKCDYKTYKYENMVYHKDSDCGMIPLPEPVTASQSFSDMDQTVSDSTSDYSHYSSPQSGKSASPLKSSPRSRAAKDAQNAHLSIPDVHKCHYCDNFSVDNVNIAVIAQIQHHHKQHHPDEQCVLVNEKNRFLNKPSRTFVCVEYGCTFFAATAAMLFAHQAGHEDPTMKEFHPESDVLATYDDVMDL